MKTLQHRFYTCKYDTYKYNQRTNETDLLQINFGQENLCLIHWAFLWVSGFESLNTSFIHFWIYRIAKALTFLLESNLNKDKNHSYHLLVVSLKLMPYGESNQYLSPKKRSSEFGIESPFLFRVQFGCNWDRNYGFIGQDGYKPSNFVE